MTADSSKSSRARRFIGHASIYAIGNIVRHIASFLMLPIYTRCLSPADYGVVGLMTFSISLIELVFGARLGLAIPKYYFNTQDDHIRNAVISTALIITGTFSSVTVLVLILFRIPASQGIFGTPVYANIFALFATQLLSQALESYGLLFVRLQQRPWLFISLSLSKLVLQLTFNIWLIVIKGLGVMGIAISGMVSSFLFAIILMIYTLRHVGVRFELGMAQKMIRFCWPLWLAGFAGLYIGSGNRYYLRIFSSLNDVGLYELASKFSNVITMLIWEPFSQYWQVERFRYYQQDNAQYIFQQVFLGISTLLVLAALGISIFAGPVIRIMADSAFYHAADSVPFLMFGVVFSSLVYFSNFSFLINEETSWLTRSNYITAALVTILYLVLVPLAGHVGAALSLMLAQGFQFILVHRVSRRYYDMGISLIPLAKIVIISAITCLLANGLLTGNNFYENLAIKSVAYAFAALFILRPVWKKPEARRLFKDIISPLYCFAKNR